MAEKIVLSCSKCASCNYTVPARWDPARVWNSKNSVLIALGMPCTNKRYEF